MYDAGAYQAVSPSGGLPLLGTMTAVVTQPAKNAGFKKKYLQADLIYNLSVFAHNLLVSASAETTNLYVLMTSLTNASLLLEASPFDRYVTICSPFLFCSFFSHQPRQLCYSLL